MLSNWKTIVAAIKKLDVQHGRSMPDLSPKDTIIPITIVSLCLFCMWGLAYGLLDIMNYHVRVAMDLKREDAAILAAGYYGAYIPGALLLAGPLVEKKGYRIAMILGLFLLAIGDFLMSVAAASCNFGGMVAAHFVIGLGVSTLERSANPYAVNCGPRNQGTLRILIAQAWAGIGTVIAPFLANAFVFDPNKSSLRPPLDPLRPGKCIPGGGQAGSCANLGSVIVFYRALGGWILGLMLFCVIILFRTNWLPEVPVPRSPKTECGWRLWKHPLLSLPYARLWWGVAANFVNLGCQVTFAQFFLEHMKVNACASDIWAAQCMSIAQGFFVMGRFAAAGLVTFPRTFKPRYVLLLFIGGAVATTAAGTGITGSTAIAVAVMVMFFEAPSFPMIFESATADFERWTPTAETLMITSITGGALQPALMGKLVTSIQISKAWWLTASCFLFVFLYPLATNTVPSFRHSLDHAQLEPNTATRAGIADFEASGSNSSNSSRAGSKAAETTELKEYVTGESPKPDVATAPVVT